MSPPGRVQPDALAVFYLLPPMLRQPPMLSATPPSPGGVPSVPGGVLVGIVHPPEPPTHSTCLQVAPQWPGEGVGGCGHIGRTAGVGV